MAGECAAVTTPPDLDPIRGPGTGSRPARDRSPPTGEAHARTPAAALCEPVRGRAVAGVGAPAPCCSPPGTQAGDSLGHGGAQRRRSCERTDSSGHASSPSRPNRAGRSWKRRQAIGWKRSTSWRSARACARGSSWHCTGGMWTWKTLRSTSEGRCSVREAPS